MAATLVTLTQAQAHLRLPVTTDADTSDPDLVLKLQQAEAIVLAYCGTAQYWRDKIATWDASTVPADVTAAILLQLGELWRYRGDDLEGQGAPRAMTEDDLAPVVARLLRRKRDPVIA